MDAKRYKTWMLCRWPHYNTIPKALLNQLQSEVSLNNITSIWSFFKQRTFCCMKHNGLLRLFFLTSTVKQNMEGESENENGGVCFNDRWVLLKFMFVCYKSGGTDTLGSVTRFDSAAPPQLPERPAQGIKKKMWVYNIEHLNPTN